MARNERKAGFAVSDGKEVYVTPSGLTHTAGSLAGKGGAIFEQRVDRGIRQHAQISSGEGSVKVPNLLAKFNNNGRKER